MRQLCTVKKNRDTQQTKNTHIAFIIIVYYYNYQQQNIALKLLPVEHISVLVLIYFLGIGSIRMHVCIAN